MRRKTDKGSHGRKLIAGTAVAGLCLYGSFAVHRLSRDSGSARVVSIEQIEDADGRAVSGRLAESRLREPVFRF